MWRISLAAEPVFAALAVGWNPHFRHAKRPIWLVRWGPRSSMAGSGGGSMSGCRSTGSDRKVTAVTARRAVFALALLVAGAVAAQETEQRTEPPPNAAPPPFGMLETLGRWLEDSKARIDNHIKGTA